MVDETPAYWIAPHFASSDLEGEPNVEQMVMLFSDSVMGWLLDPAEELMQLRGLRAGYASLGILMSYFESLPQYRDGVVDGRGRSKSLFTAGVSWVFDRFPPEHVEQVATVFYEDGRNGLYHEMLARGRLVPTILEGKVLEVRRNEVGATEVAVDALGLAKELKRHFAKYVMQLLDPTKSELRAAFVQRFKAPWGPDDAL